MPRIPPALHARWLRLPIRERRALLGLAAFLGLSLAWVLLWQPQRQALLDAERHYQDELRLHADLQRLPGDTGGGPRIDATALPGLLARSSAQARLNVERMDSEGSGRMNLALEGQLADLLGWFESLGRSGVEVTSLDLEVSPDALARARLAVELR
ncbi:MULTISPECIES: type II secretion system protein GspM [Pseudomonas aeruginosa group]|uniref:type II secretion system protein GspM n=1 Tax=Pseudomonas aeruginosa group TaxID=136841 RepID=UPI00086E0D44|nr:MULTISPECIES: type II secretion system protein GspM [Pseudomonas aeruginosa group]MBG3904494.1 type II secretion system protein M [Pseudomonas aeruginosa]MBG4200774.1 type II secretion system protein M [Pseudomonas aeruginosa]MBG4279087.1 type II secretion system protein M [Pseudomonas aeruginosa]MBG6890639.1 type II secretion system protein M [Pseudomonas aeruginosa]MBM9933010.1 type II secretion system protein M [Pseudomonas aeruginosa]